MSDSSIGPVTSATASVSTNRPELVEGQLLPRNKALISDPAYNSFMRSLDLAYGLQNVPAGNLKWVDIKGLGKTSDIVTTPPRVLINPGFDHPKLAVALFPKASEDAKRSVTGSDAYHAPIIVRDVNRWKFASQKLGNYRIDGKSGAAPDKEMFSQSISLLEILKNDINLPISENTPVVEAISFLPISDDGSYLTEFAPQIRFDIGDHNYYQVMLASQNKISVFGQLIRDKFTFNVNAIEHDHSMHNFTADFIPDMDDFSKLLVPSSAGHMILIVTPIEKPKPEYDFLKDIGNYGGYGDGVRGGDIFSPTKESFRGTIGGVDIGLGSKIGAGSLYEGDVTSSRNGNATIFHIRLLGVKPDGFEKISQNVGNLEGAIDSYSSKN